MELDPDAAPTVSVDVFFSCDLRVGTVLACAPNARARKPSYVLSIDFGPLGTRKSSAQLTGLYSADDMVGRQVVAVVNLPPRDVAGVCSECLVLGLEAAGGVVLLAPERPVADGSHVS